MALQMIRPIAINLSDFGYSLKLLSYLIKDFFGMLWALLEYPCYAVLIFAGILSLFFGLFSLVFLKGSKNSLIQFIRKSKTSVITL